MAERSGPPAATTSAIVRSVAAYLILPNLLFAVSSMLLYLVRSLVNIDYLLLGLLVPPRRRWLLAAGFAILLLLDAAEAMTPVYHFPVADMLPSLSDILMVANLRTIPWALLGIACAGGVGILAALIAGSPSRSGPPRLSLAAIAVAVVALDLANGTSRFAPANRVTVRVNVATSTLFRLGYAAVRASRERAAIRTGAPAEAESSATGALLAAARGGAGSGRRPSDENVVLVIVESLGLFKDSAENRVFRAPFETPGVLGRYTVIRGDVPFSGATTWGEFRELCGVFFSHQLVGRQSLPVNCLPSALRPLGYSTIAIHGYRSSLFQRGDWYPQIGFDRRLFAEDLAREVGDRRCGVMFRGICDVDAAAVLRAEVLRAPVERKRFVYWLTLNSHFPVDKASAEGSSFDCEEDPEASRSETLCLEMRIWHRVAQDVADLAADPVLPATRFIVVGDHSPPFASERMRQLFVDRRVPFVELIPRRGRRR